MAQSPGGAGSGSSDADPRGQSGVPGPEFPTVTWFADRAVPPRPPSEADEPHSPTEVDASHPPTEVDPSHPATEVEASHPSTEVDPSHPATEVDPSHPPTEVDSPYRLTETGGYGSEAPGGRTVSVGGAAGGSRFGPGVPVSSPAGEAGTAAEQVWRTGQLPAPPRRRRRVRRMASSALTVVLLAAAGVVLFLRLHHGPLHVTGVAITRQAASGCAVNVTGRITTNGSAGTVSYQWVFQPQPGPPQPLNQSVTAGQNAVYVTVAVDGQAHARTAENVTLQVLGPGTGSASARVVVSC